MPNVLKFNGYRLFFYSNENDEPIHIHIQKAENYAKLWVKPIAIAYNHGFTNKEI
ncbi:MAG: DUF4160 domain-containing protein [Spirochaetes bacterium]|nr:DUF4160 domain-containing protein [Spirochaetota bacterium]